MSLALSGRRGLDVLKARSAQPGAPRFGKYPLRLFSRLAPADARVLVRIDDDAGDRPSPTLVQTDASVLIVSALREPITVLPLRKARL